jgi:hypothetical protein
MANIIKSNPSGHSVLVLKEFFITRAEEQYGLKTQVELEKYISEREKAILEYERTELVHSINDAGWNERRRLKKILQTFPNEGDKEKVRKEKERERSYLELRDVVKYRLERTGEFIPSEGLKLVCVEPLAPIEIIEKDGRSNGGLKEAVLEADNIANVRGFPYVSLSGNISQLLVPRNRAVSDNYSIILANLYADVRGEKA